jgi:hypothetical protein
MRSDLKSSAKKYGIEEFYSKTAEIVKSVVLDEDAEKGEGAPKGRIFKQNGMCVTDVEVLEVEVEASVAKMLDRHQNEMISKMLELSDATRKAEVTAKLAEFERKEAQLAYETKMYQLDLTQKAEAEKLANAAEIAAMKRAEDAASKQAQADMQVILDAIQKAQLARDRAADDEKIKTETALAEIEKAKQEAYAATVAKIYAAISPDLVAALQAQANASMANGIGQAVAPYAIAKGESVSDAVNTLLRGTSLEKTLKNVAEVANS